MLTRLEEAENFYGSIRNVRHEMKNHMVNIKGLAGAGEYGEIEEYVRRMDETMQELEYKYVTGNAVTDSSSMTNAAGLKRRDSGLMQIFGMAGKFP